MQKVGRKSPRIAIQLPQEWRSCTVRSITWDRDPGTMPMQKSISRSGQNECPDSCEIRPSNKRPFRPEKEEPRERNIIHRYVLPVAQCSLSAITVGTRTECEGTLPQRTTHKNKKGLWRMHRALSRGLSYPLPQNLLLRSADRSLAF